jgi:hypothetical protein
LSAVVGLYERKNPAMVQGFFVFCFGCQLANHHLTRFSIYQSEAE